ncbi:MAG: hypothetical protein HRF45_12145 [Fimbriimonadia bacterium]|jgi:hypothetical protein
MNSSDPAQSGNPSAAVEPLEYTSSVCETLAHIATAYPDTRLLTLGQTVFWDEPIKAILRRALDDHGMPIQMLLGVHDTDYFSKLPGHAGAGDGYRLLPKNDGSTRDLWTAAGEISQLFGCETVVSRDLYLEHGVAFDRIARDYPGGRDALLEQKTEAWGWRGLAKVGDDHRVAGEIPLREIGTAIESLLRWGIENTLSCLPCPEHRAEAQRFADDLMGCVHEFCVENPDSTLRDLYGWCLRRMYAQLLRYGPENVRMVATSELLRLDADTAHLPRFRLLDLFLQPETRPICEKAYNDALEGAAMYGLERFGPGALPFDVIVPGRGRGTLRLTDKYIVIMTPQPMFFSLRAPIRSAAELAVRLSEAFGGPVPVVGKAVTLVAMLSAEFLFVFHEEGSMYVSRTRRMNDLLRASGIPIEQHPILRIRYETWSSLSATQTWIRLPEHLANAFGQDEIQGPSFAQRWRAVVGEQRALLDELATIHRPRDLMALLQRRCRGRWDVLQQDYERLLSQVRVLEEQDSASREQVAALFAELRASKREYAELERKKGEDFRARMRPLLDRLAEGEAVDAEIRTEEERRAAEFDVRLALLRSRMREVRAAIADARTRRRAAFGSLEARAVREARRAIEREADLARLRMVRNAVLTVEGLIHTNHRPSAWWLPLLSPDGAWFRRMAETAQMYLEPLLS